MELRYFDQNGGQLIPTDSIVIKLDKEAVKRSGMMIPDSLHGEIPVYCGTARRKPDR